jgi:hypothetical protein
MEKASNDSMPSIAAAAEEERNLALHRGQHPKDILSFCSNKQNHLSYSIDLDMDSIFPFETILCKLRRIEAQPSKLTIEHLKFCRT